MVSPNMLRYFNINHTALTNPQFWNKQKSASSPNTIDIWKVRSFIRELMRYWCSIRGKDLLLLLQLKPTRKCYTMRKHININKHTSTENPSLCIFIRFIIKNKAAMLIPCHAWHHPSMIPEKHHHCWSRVYPGQISSHSATFHHIYFHLQVKDGPAKYEL